MYRRLVLLAGSLAVAAALVVPAFALLHDSKAPARAWVRSPVAAPVAAATPPARWDRGSSASLSMLRRVTARESKLTDATLAGCEKHAGGEVARYRACATPPLNRAQAFASVNSRMMEQLVDDKTPTAACRDRVLSLSGTTTLLAQITRETRMAGLNSGWGDVLAASRSIRGVARSTGKQARKGGWTTTCKPRRAAPATKADGRLTA
jgi:hypothetical protein